MKKILLVEDVQLIREEIRDILVMENFEVKEASNGYDGLEILNHLKPDLIISDISMPKLDGYEFLKALKKSSKTESIPVIFLSAKTELKDIRNGMNLGADDYLTKPLNPDDLILAVNKKLENRMRIDNKISELKVQITRYLPHELITPLNGILGLSEYLRDIHEITALELNKIASGIFKCGERLNRLIENYLLYTNLVLELSSNNEKSYPSDLTSISTKEIISGIANEFDETRKKDFSLKLEDIRLTFSKWIFEKIIEELMGNAIKFSFPGKDIEIISTFSQGYYNFQIQNFGSGISDKEIESIGAFVQFNREENEQQGLGLGLEIIRLIVELNRGKMLISSKLNSYFKVSILLPLK